MHKTLEVVTRTENHENDQFIARAVASHDALVECLADCLHLIEAAYAFGSLGEKSKELANDCHKVLNLAKGK